MIIREGQVWRSGPDVITVVELLSNKRVEILMSSVNPNVSTVTGHETGIQNLKDSIKVLGYTLDVLKTANNIKAQNA